MVEFGDKTEGCYAALVGDVVRSRDAPDRAALQRELRERLAQLTSALGGALAVPLTLIAGDEVQGLFRGPAAVVDVVTELGEALHPTRLVYGLGWGRVTTDLSSDPSHVDGPCFHRARASIERARRDDAWLRAEGFGTLADALLDGTFHLMHAIRSGWTRTQARTVRAVRGAPQKDVAARFGRAESTISESLKAAGFAALREGESATRALLGEFGENAEPPGNSTARAKP